MSFILKHKSLCGFFRGLMSALLWTLGCKSMRGVVEREACLQIILLPRQPEGRVHECDDWHCLLYWLTGFNRTLIVSPKRLQSFSLFCYPQYIKSVKGETVVQWLALWSHCKEVVGSVTGPRVSVWVLSGLSRLPSTVQTRAREANLEL